MRRASEVELRRMNDTFAELCAISSPSRRERAVADRVAGELRALGLAVEEDRAGDEIAGNAGNLLARLPGEHERSVLLCAHMDTVPHVGPIEPVLVDGGWESAGDTVLGADNKAAVAVLLGVARRAAGGSPPVGIELLLTTAEELALRGAREVERSTLRSAVGFVFDHASPIGELVVASPSFYRLVADFRGAAAHAGIRPEDGRNAIAAAAAAIGRMRIGRIDESTTANVGTIEGGTAVNVVAERCRVELECRSLDDEQAGWLVGDMVDACAEAASDAECDVETVVEQLFRAYRLPRTAPVVQTAAYALEALGIEPTYIATGGGSDANALIAAGLPVLNVANGTEKNHQPDESVTVEALHTGLDLALEIVNQAATSLATEH